MSVCVCRRLIVIKVNTGPRCHPGTGKKFSRISKREKEELQAVYLNVLSRAEGFIMRCLESIEIVPKIMHGRPCIRIMPVPVYLVRNVLGKGMQEKGILASHPDLVIDDIRACIAWGAVLAGEELGIGETSRVV